MLSIIAAIAKNNVIGKDNKLIWHISEDLKRFKEKTLNHPIIMGRKTFESLPKLLPERHHFVLTNNKNYLINNQNVTIVHSIEELLKITDNDLEYFIIGGAKIYEEFLPFCNKLYITHIDKEYDGDAYFPIIDENKWTIVDPEPYHLTKEGIFIKYTNYVKKY